MAQGTHHFDREARNWDRNNKSPVEGPPTLALRLESRSLSTLASELALLDRELRRLMSKDAAAVTARSLDQEAFVHRMDHVRPLLPAKSGLAIERVQEGSIELIVGGVVGILVSDPATALTQLATLLGGAARVRAYLRERWNPNPYGKDLDVETGSLLYSNDRTGERIYGTRAVITRTFRDGGTEQVIMERATNKP
jgi:hypothetical protein